MEVSHYHQSHWQWSAHCGKIVIASVNLSWSHNCSNNSHLCNMQIIKNFGIAKLKQMIDVVLEILLSRGRQFDWTNLLFIRIHTSTMPLVQLDPSASSATTDSLRNLYLSVCSSMDRWLSSNLSVSSICRLNWRRTSESLPSLSALLVGLLYWGKSYCSWW